MPEMKSLADESRRLKKVYAELAMQKEQLKDTLGNSSSGTAKMSDDQRGCLEEGTAGGAAMPDLWHQRDLLPI